MQSAAASRLEAASRSASCDASVRAAVLLPASCVALRLLLRGAVLLSGSCNDEAAAGVEAAGSSICTTQSLSKTARRTKTSGKNNLRTELGASQSIRPDSAWSRSPCKNVEAAIAQDPGNREWTTLRNDLLEVIELTGELGQIKSTESAPAREVELRTYSVGEKCQAIFEMDGSWYNAKIVALAEDGYFVTFLGYGNTAQVEFNEVRPYQRPDTSLLVPGEEVSAVHSDARWYDAVLNEIKGKVAFVTFKGETEPAEVDLDFVRPKSVSVERKRK
eukprot:scaffold46743_cov63-Phaeocystis_antarctica.AAC.1